MKKIIIFLLALLVLFPLWMWLAWLLTRHATRLARGPRIRLAGKLLAGGVLEAGR